MKRLTFILALLIVFTSNSYSQQYKDMIDSGTYTVFEIQEVAEAYFEMRETGKGSAPTGGSPRRCRSGPAGP